jgi:cellobiose phosphorylase
MSIQEINELANDIMVSRLTIKALEEERAELTRVIDEKLENEKLAKTSIQERLLSRMQGNGLKSWKTEKANYARATRKSVVFDPILKQQIEKRVKAGEAVENWELKETEYISIRLTK